MKYAEMIALGDLEFHAFVRSMYPLSETVWTKLHFMPLFKERGWRGFHTTRSFKQQMDNFPDWVLIRRRETIFVETKGEGKGPSVGQQDALAALSEAGNRVYLWQPNDWREILEVLA